MLSKLKNLLKNKKVMALTMATVMCLALGCTCFAASGDLANSLDFSPIVTAVTDKISPTDIILVISAVVAVGMGFVLAWFGIKKVIRALSNAIMKGRIKA